MSPVRGILVDNLAHPVGFLLDYVLALNLYDLETAISQIETRLTAAV